MNGAKLCSRGQPLDLSQRKCLLCSKDFKSWGKGNRICPMCKKQHVFHTTDIMTATNIHEHIDTEDEIQFPSHDFTWMSKDGI